MARTLLSLLGLRWYEYVLIGALVVATVAGWFWRQSFITTTEKLEDKTAEVQEIQEDLVETTQRTDIDQTVVSMINHELVTTRYQQTDTREALINEYLFYLPEEDQPAEVTPEPEPEVKVASAPAPSPIKPVESPVASPTVQDDEISSSRIRQLTSGMRDVYCAAARSDTAGCTSE